MKIFILGAFGRLVCVCARARASHFHYELVPFSDCVDKPS